MFRSLFFLLFYLFSTSIYCQNLRSMPVDSLGLCTPNQAGTCWLSDNPPAPIGQNPYAQLQKEKYYVSQWGQSSGKKIFFLEFLPTQYQDSTNKNFPLIIYLHGNESKVPAEVNCLCFTRYHTLPGAINEGSYTQGNSKGMFDSFYKNQFIVISPMRPVDLYPASFTTDLIDEIIDMASENYRVDKEKIYLMGTSQGGGDALMYVGSSSVYTKRIAAVATFSANGGKPDLGCHTVAENKIGIWAFQIDSRGEEESEKIVNAIRSCPSPLSAEVLLTKSMVNNNDPLLVCTDILQYEDGTGCHNIPAHQHILRGGNIMDTTISIYDWLIKFPKLPDANNPITSNQARNNSPEIKIVWNEAASRMEIKMVESTPYNIDLFTLDNKQIYSNRGVGPFYFNMPDIPGGIYLVRITLDHNVVVKKMMVKN